MKLTNCLITNSISYVEEVDVMKMSFITKQISYNVNIWDTNTHNVYPSGKRREIAEKYWPYFGKEIERPKTRPIHIGDDCWIGENTSILKGTNLSNNVIVGFGTVLTGVKVEEGKTVMNKVELRIL